MKIKEITYQHRRDFTADYECEHCGHILRNQRGYDDENYHQNVIPAMTCPACGMKAAETYRQIATKYPEGYQI